MGNPKKIASPLIIITFTLLCFQQISAAQNTDVLSDLALEDILNMEVTSVSKIAEKSNQAPAVVNVITNEMIRTNGYRTLYDVLVQTPGFWPIQDVNDKLIGVRGVHASTSQKFLLLINGRRITENLWNFTDIDYDISLQNVKAIEIIRGPGSAVYGRAALTSVINIITFSGEELDGIGFEISLGNHGYKKMGVAYGTKTESGAEIEVSAHGTAIKGQVKEVGASEDGANNRVSGKEVIDRFKFPTGSFNSRFHNDKWVANLFFLSRNYQDPRAANAGLIWQDMEDNNYFGSLYGDRLLGEEHQYLIFDLQRNFEYSGIKNAFTFNYTFSRLRLRECAAPVRDITFPDEWADDEKKEYAFGQLFEFDIESYRVGVEYFGNFSFSENKKAIWGAEAYRTMPISDQFRSNYTTSIVDNKLIKTPTKGGHFREIPSGLFDKLRTEYLYSAYAELRYGIYSKLTLNFGARYDLHQKGDDYKGEGSAGRYPDALADAKRAEVKEFESQLSPRVAVIYQPAGNDQLTLKTIYNRSFIAPCYFYRYADPSTSYAGGPWLKSEILDNYIIASESIFSLFGFKALYFLNINKDLLSRDVSLTPARYTSLGKLSMQGVEFDLYARKSIITVSANYSYLAGIKSLTNESTAKSWIMDNKTIKNFPKHCGTTGLTAHLLEKQLDATVYGHWYHSIMSPIGTGSGAGTIEKLDGKIITNIVLRYKPKWYSDMDLNLSVYNLADKTIRLGGTTKRPYHQAGRWFNVSLITKF